jgi:hypothetical protein
MSAPAVENKCSTDMKLVTRKAPAAVVWSDDFNDGNMDGWDCISWPDMGPSNFTVINGVVYAQGDIINAARHESSVAYGTWSIDIYIAGEELSAMEFISDAPYGSNVSQNGYELIFASGSLRGTSSNQIHFVELYATSTTSYQLGILDSYRMNPAGWHHVDITRDTSGYFCVYFNNTPIIELVDNTVKTSNGFALAFEENAGCAFDNVVVSDSVDIDLVGPFFLQDLEDQLVTEGVAFEYQINATDSTGIDSSSWEINDTANFAIDSTGKITNASTLSPNVYNLEVSVSDTLSNTRRASFSVIVVAPLPPGEAPYFLTLLVVGGGVIAVVVIIVLVIFMKKRS